MAPPILKGELSYFEGAVSICLLRHSIRVPDNDTDINAFVLISSETDHLPLQRVRHRWSPEALRNLTPEFERIEEWARLFASLACQRLIVRFASAQQCIQSNGHASSVPVR